MRSIDILKPNKSIEFYFVEDFGMNELANHEDRVAVKPTEAEAMVSLFR